MLGHIGNSPPKRWLTPKEYARHYGLHVQTVYHAIREDRLPHTFERFGRIIRIDSATRDSHRRSRT
jgi:excisionase family DNA binding protein